MVLPPSSLRRALLADRPGRGKPYAPEGRAAVIEFAQERRRRGASGCKNHYGSRSRRGTEVASIFYSLLETAKLTGIDAAKYVREAALADARGEVLLPADFVVRDRRRHLP